MSEADKMEVESLKAKVAQLEAQLAAATGTAKPIVTLKEDVTPSAAAKVLEKAKDAKKKK